MPLLQSPCTVQVSRHPQTQPHANCKPQTMNGSAFTGLYGRAEPACSSGGQASRVACIQPVGTCPLKSRQPVPKRPHRMMRVHTPPASFPHPPSFFRSLPASVRASPRLGKRVSVIVCRSSTTAVTRNPFLSNWESLQNLVSGVTRHRCLTVINYSTNQIVAGNLIACPPMVPRKCTRF